MASGPTPGSEAHRPPVRGEWLIGALALLTLLVGARPAQALSSAEIAEVSLLTMGPGESLYARFGHAALLVRTVDGGERVINYGYTSFGDRELVQRFLRGEARFWVAESSLRATLDDYRHEDRTVYRQVLAFDERERAQLRRLLALRLRPEARVYSYHHFWDNCSTRLRDLVDRTTDGAVARALRGVPGPRESLRELVRRGFAGEVGLLLAVDLVIGRAVDRRLDAWEATFLPRELLLGVQRVRPGAEALAGPPQVLQARRGADPLAHDAHAGQKILWALVGGGSLAALLLVLAAWRRSRLAGLALLYFPLLLGPGALLVWALAIYSTLPELRINELVLILWPTDLLLLWVAVRWLRGRLVAGGLLRAYATLRLAGVVAVLGGHAFGLLYQEPRVWLVLGLVWAGGLYGAVALLRHRPPLARPPG